MKKWIHSKESILAEIHFTDLFDSIAAVYYVDDIDTKDDIFGASYTTSYYQDCTDEDLLELSKDKIAEIEDLYTIYRINQLNPELLTRKQKKDLAQMYRLNPEALMSGGIKVFLDETDVAKILEMLKQHKRVQGPFYRYDEPEKNFAELHDLNLGPKDYAYILHQLTVEECTITTPYKTFSYSDKEPGNELLVFNVEKEIDLPNGGSIGNFKIYMKIDLTKTFKNDNRPIVLISFHE